MRDELGRAEHLLAGEERPSPRIEPAHEDRAAVMTEMPEQPPEPLGAAHRPVGHHERVRGDPGTGRGGGEALGRGQRMAPRVRHRQIGQILLDVEKRGAGDVPLEVAPAAAAGRTELPTTVDEEVAHSGPSLATDLRSSVPGE